MKCNQACSLYHFAEKFLWTVDSLQITEISLRENERLRKAILEFEGVLNGHSCIEHCDTNSCFDSNEYIQPLSLLPRRG